MDYGMGAEDVSAGLSRVRDGVAWPIGGPAEVKWIRDGTSITRSITAAIPPVFADYATLVLPQPGSPPGAAGEQHDHDEALLALLGRHTVVDRWWLGYLDTGADDVVFDDAPRVRLYADWPYVLVGAGPQQARTWRADDGGSFWKGPLPNLVFPADRTWLVSTLWDDDWTCIGGSGALVADLLADPELGPRARRVSVDGDATPPGHQAW